MSKKIELSEEQEQYLIANYNNTFLKDMADYLQVSMSTMQRLSDKYGFNRTRKKGWRKSGNKRFFESKTVVQ